MNKPVNFITKFKKFNDYWSPKVIAEMNNYQFKLVKIKGEFVRHSHIETDESFIVVEGEMQIEYDDKTICVKAGEMIVVKKGVNHKPIAINECKILIIEPKDIVNTGKIECELTAENDVWI